MVVHTLTLEVLLRAVVVLVLVLDMVQAAVLLAVQVERVL
jgi:hypothetical protein